MPKSNLLTSLVLAIMLLATQTRAILAAGALQAAEPVRGAVESITLETDTITGITTVTVTLVDQDELFQTVRVSIRTALVLGLVRLDGDGKPGANNSFLGQFIEIEPALVIPEREVDHHPVGNALATLFSNVPGVNYATIMAAHGQGIGFGVIAQALWLTARLEGDSGVFQVIVAARQSGDYTAFLLEDGTTPKNWDELRNAILDTSKKGNPGIMVAGPAKDKGKGDDKGNGDQGAHGNGDKEKEKDKQKDSNGNGNGAPGANGNNNGNDNGKDKEKNNNGNGNDKKN